MIFKPKKFVTGRVENPRKIPLCTSFIDELNLAVFVLEAIKLIWFLCLVTASKNSVDFKNSLDLDHTVIMCCYLLLDN